MFNVDHFPWNRGQKETPRFSFARSRKQSLKVRFAEFVTSVGRPDQIPQDGLPEIAFAGRSNVGKSSLLNCLLNRKALAKTSRTPGKTRTLNYYIVNRELYLVDLPGYGYARRSHSEREQWAMLVNAYIQDRTPLKGIVQLVDARHDPTADDLEMIEWLNQSRKPFLVVATKADLLSGSRFKPRLDQTLKTFQGYGSVEFVPFSAKTGRGKKNVWGWIDGKV